MVHAEQLQKAGYEVRMFADSFRDELTRQKQDSIKDPDIMRLCNSEKWLLVTTDHEMLSTHVSEIKKYSELAILATAHNSAPDFNVWIDALIKGKVAILAYFKKQERPCFATINTSGRLTTKKTITALHFTRRHRPREQAKAS